MHTAIIMAAWRDGDAAFETLTRLSGSCLGSNLFTYHNDWRDMGLTLDGGGAPPFQIDANMGWTAAVQNMLVSGTIGRENVLPALPSHWRSGEVSGICSPVGISTSVRWDAARRMVEVELASDRDQVVDVRFRARIRSTAAPARFEGDTVRGLRLKSNRSVQFRVILERLFA